MTQFHAGPRYTRSQQEQLDTAFAAWLRVEVVAEYDVWRDEGKNQAAATAYAAYKALSAEFDAANETPAPDPWSFRRYVDDNYIDDDEYIHSHPGNGWGL